jgi:hypothetical protein
MIGVRRHGQKVGAADEDAELTLRTVVTGRLA